MTQLAFIKKKDQYQDIRELIALLSIHAFIHKLVSSYSSGMLKKLSLLLAFKGTPREILSDEPWIKLIKQTVPLLYNMGLLSVLPLTSR
jgi:ABC-2 type transport system ATP-binding protein